MYLWYIDHLLAPEAVAKIAGSVSLNVNIWSWLQVSIVPENFLGGQWAEKAFQSDCSGFDIFGELVTLLMSSSKL